MDTIFLYVVKLLAAMAAYLGISYAKANVMVYFFLLPVVFSGLMDIIFRTSACRIAVAVFWLAVLTACRDFNAAADAVYSASVTFLEAFSVIGLSYATSSVLVCVVLPGAALLVLSVLALRHGSPCRQVIPALCAILFLPQLHAEAQTAASTPQPTAQVSPALELKNQQDKLTTETAISDLELKKSLSSLSAEKQRRELEAAVAQQQLQAEIASVQEQIQKLFSQTDLAARQAAYKALERKNKLDAELADQRDELERFKLANETAAAGLAAKQKDLLLRDQEASLRTKELLNQKAELDFQVARLSTELDLREKRDQWKSRVNREITYTKEPFKDGVLTISDRRIALNGPIVMETANEIQERIDYFNNQSAEFPIFIVIDSSPGGSVMAGYKILKAMSGSAAPVYVVVKSFAASMAAGIAALAPRSFAYPNAIIVHHEILKGSFGNLTQQKEGLKDFEEWWKRLAAPIAAKMGIPLDEFTRQMYLNSSTGEWKEFGDRAQELRWVDGIAETIREDSLVKNPDSDPKGSKQAAGEYLQAQADADGRRHFTLPRLNPVDCYYLYNPDDYYRLAK
jgi:ATP-dependent Clp protease protease subunit